jgi:translocation and assembly module TamB
MRRLIRYIVHLLLFTVGLAAIVLGLLATPFGRGIVAAVAERAASSDGLTVSIDRMTGWPPFWAGVEKLTLSDGSGQFAEIDDISVDVDIWRLLSGTLTIDAVSAARIAVDRAPVRAQGARSGAGGLLPFVAERISIAELVLGDALAGRRAVLTVEGSASSGADGSLHLDVKAERIDGLEGSFAARLDRANGAAPFAADINVSEAADGILVGLIGRPSGPAYRLDAEAVPQGDAVHGSVTLASEQSAQFNGRFALTPDGDAKRLQVTASGDLAELVPPEYANLLSGPIDIGLDADWTTADGSMLPEIAIRQGRVSTAAIDASASGTLSREVADLSLQVNIADPAGDVIALPMLPGPSELERVSLRGTVAPSNGVVRADLLGNITNLQFAGVSVPAAGLSLAVETVSGGTLFDGSLPFSLRLEADAVRTASGGIAATAEAPLLVVADGTIDAGTATAEVDATVQAGGGQARFDGSLSADAITGSARVAFADVQALARLAGHEISGGVDATAEGRFFGANGIDLTIAADLTDLDPGQDTLARLVQGASKVTVGLATNDEGAVTLSNLDLTGRSLEASGNATIGAGTISASIQGTVADLSLLADNTGGSAAFTADLSGPLAGPEVEASISIGEGQLLGRPIRDGVVRLEGRPSQQGWTANATLGGSFADKPLSGNVEVMATTVESGLSFPAIDLTIDDNRIHGSLERTGDGLLSGTLDVEAPNLSTLAALALVEASGSATARVSLTPTDDRQTVAVDFSGSNVAYLTVAVRSLEGQARVEDAFGTPRIDGSARATGATVGTLHLDSVTAEASSDGSTTSFQLAASGPNTDLRGAGSLTSEAGVNVLRLDTVSGSAYQVPVALQSPVTVRFDDTSSGLPTMRIAVGGGTIVVNGSVSPQLDLTAVAERIPASVANGFAPNLGAGGTVSGRATVTGATASPTVSWQADWAAMSIAATQRVRLPPLQVSARGSATRTRTTLDGTLTGAGLSLGFRGSVPFTGSGLSVTVTGTAPLALLALETTREVRLAGNARIDLRVTGSAQAPQYAGTATLVDATVVDGETGFGIAGAGGRIAFDGRRASTERISGRISQGGTINIASSVDIASGQFPANLRINIANGRYNDGEVVNARFNANLVVSGPLLGSATLSGTVALGRTEIQLPDRISADAAAIQVRHVNAPPSFVPPLSAESRPARGPSPTGSLRLDVQITNSGGIFVRGFGVDSEFGGSLRVTNTISSPQAVGAFTMRRGRIEVLGRRFELTSGTLTFAGDLTPFVNFTATTRTSDAAVSVNVVGPADDPTIVFTSTPELPQEEILSRLLFDRNVSSLSVLQVAQLLDAAAQFSGGTRGQGFFSRIRNALGVDDLDIRQNASGGTTVGLGKRINEKVSVGVEAGTNSGDDRVRIDLDLTPNLKATGSAGTGGSGSIGLTYEREY